MLYLFLADGFEEIEALAPIDFLRRADIDIVTVGVTGDIVRGAHNIRVQSDISVDDISLDNNLKGIILPGGMPGSENLNNSENVQKAIDYCNENNLLICAICAAPFVLGRKGLLNGKNATCFPGFENELTGATVKENGVVRDGNIITARGAGVAWEFGAEIAAEFAGRQKSEEILKAIQWKK